MTNNNQIRECILNIDMICRSMYLSYQDVKILKIPLDSVIYGDILRYSYIQLCSILDEFVVLHGCAKNDEYLRDTLYTLSPALKAINEYTGIRKARNIMLAHFNRDRNKKFVPWWAALRGLKLPRTQGEIRQIYVWIHLVNSIIVSRYYDELKEISELAKSDVDEYFHWVKAEEKDAIKNQKLFVNVFEEVGKRLNEKNIQQLIIDPIMKDLIVYLSDKN